MTPTDICNLALDIMKEAEITNLERDDRSIVRWMKRNFDVSRDSLLARYDWNFALKRAMLTKDSEAPAFGWLNRFTVPSDCLRVLPLTAGGNSEGSPIQHEIEGQHILTNAPASLLVRYLARTEDYDRYPAVFIEALASYLAMKCGHFVTGKISYVQVAQGLHQEAINAAWRVNAIEGTSPRAADNEWVEQR
jgi:hypothetical protein